MTEVPRVLLVEDDPQLSSMLDELLTDEGYEVVAVRDGQKGLHRGLTESFDVFVLDRGLPVVEGLDLLTRLRNQGVLTPALILSALANPADRVEGLDAGAEDYVGKPFDVDELLARLRALRRRHVATAAVLVIPGGSLDTESRTVTLANGDSMVLSDREAALLEHLARGPRQVFTRADLLATVFTQADDDGVVDTYVHYLRKKVGRASIDTVRGIGYRLGRIR